MGLFEPLRRSSEAARSACSLFRGRLVLRGNTVTICPLWMSRATVSLSMEMPLLASWFGTPFRLSPSPFHTPVKSGWPSAVRGVVPAGFGGALTVRGPRWASCAMSAAETRHNAAAAPIILLERIRPLSVHLPGWRRRVGRVGQELEVAAVGHLQFLREAAVRAVAGSERDDGQLVTRLQPAPVGAAQTGTPEAGEARHLEGPLRHLAVGSLDVDRQVGVRVDELDACHRAADGDRLVDVELRLDGVVRRYEARHRHAQGNRQQRTDSHTRHIASDG